MIHAGSAARLRESGQPDAALLFSVKNELSPNYAGINDDFWQ
jgi:hypothetical protein